MADWVQIVATHGPAVYRLAWRILGQADDAEDVVQDVFLQAYQLQRTETVRCWPAFLRRLTSHRSLDRLRQRKKAVTLDGLELPAPGDGPEELAAGNELAERLRLAVAGLPPREGEVFCLRHFEDLSYQEIAKSLKIQVGAVAAALHKARGRLEPMFLRVMQEELG